MFSDFQSMFGDPWGFLFKDEQNQFIYFCGKCGERFISGSELEQHIILHYVKTEDDPNIDDLPDCEAAELPIVNNVPQFWDDFDEPTFDEGKNIIKFEPEQIASEDGIDTTTNDLHNTEDSQTSQCSTPCAPEQMSSEDGTDTSQSSTLDQNYEKKRRKISKTKQEHDRIKLDNDVAVEEKQKKHKKVPKNQRQYCATCKRFPSVPMSKHIESYHSCKFCGEILAGVSSRIEHMRTHVGEHRFKCAYDGCDKSYYDKTLLKTHVDTQHLHLRPFLCDKCGKDFGTSKHLKQHKFTHGEKTFQCKVCDKRFATLTGLSQHDKWNHREKIKKS